MNIEISTSGIARSVNDYKPSSSLPQPSILLKKDHESWRGSSSSGFGLANLLNRNNSSSAAPPLPLPKFNLPSLQSFGKPLITKPDPSMNRSRSILNESSPAPSAKTEASLVEASPLAGTSSGLTVPITETPQKTVGMSARRLAPARLDEEDGDGEVEETSGAITGNIRGGRWSAEEHDRFLAGFRIHGHKWKRVQQVVRTRSVTQVRTHAQKYLLKLAKLNADKKNTASEGDTHTHSSSDTETTQTAGSTPEDSDARSPRKKARRSLNVDTVGAVDEEYISAAATTLCFLMRQKIDSLFDSRHDDDEKNLEPYDCYSNESIDTSGEHNIERSRKRPYMDFINETTTDYHDQTPEASTYSIEGKQLCS